MIYRGNLYLVDTSDDHGNYLVSLEFTGKERWRCSIGKGTIQRSPAISSDGIVYIVIESQGANHIAAYDLKQSGKALYEYNLEENSKLANYTALTIGNDGSIFLALNKSNVNYIYGFTPGLQPFLKAGPFPGDNNKTLVRSLLAMMERKSLPRFPPETSFPPELLSLILSTRQNNKELTLIKSWLIQRGLACHLNTIMCP